MPTCSQCHRKWTWADTIKRAFKKKKKCPYCGEIQYTSFKTSQRIAWYGLIIPIVFIVISLFSLPTYIGIIVSAIIIVISIITQPFLTVLSNKEEFPE